MNACNAVAPVTVHCMTAHCGTAAFQTSEPPLGTLSTISYARMFSVQPFSIDKTDDKEAIDLSASHLYALCDPFQAAEAPAGMQLTSGNSPQGACIPLHDPIQAVLQEIYDVFQEITAGTFEVDLQSTEKSQGQVVYAIVVLT